MRAALALLAAVNAVAAADLCARGLRASLNDKVVCCPRACETCDESQCQLGNGRCCPAQILKKRVPCEAKTDVGCAYTQNLDKLHTVRAVRGLIGHFCREGVRGTSGERATCCPKHCKRCDSCPGDCCGALFQKSCATPIDTDCQGPRPELELTDFKGARRDPQQKPVDIVIAGDRVQALGLMACAKSCVDSTRRPGRLRFHLIVDPPSVNVIQAAAACAISGSGASVRVYGFDWSAYKRNPELTISAPVNSRKGNLSAEANFARFYLPEMLPNDVEKVVYLDADTVVRKDVAHLYDTSLTASTSPRMAVAAVSRRYKPMCGSWLACRSTQVQSLLRSQGIDDPAAQLDTFNAGVLVLHLKRWRAMDYTRRVEFWMKWNTDLRDPCTNWGLYKLGSNPPLILTVRQDFQRLDNRWNCQRGHACWDRGDAGLLHWSGAAKPWYLTFSRDHFDWRPFLEEPCVGVFGEDLGKTPSYNAAPKLRNACKPKNPIRRNTSTECTSPHCFRKNAEPTKEDKDKLWELHELVQRLDEPGALVEAVSGFQERLDDELKRQVDAWPPMALARYLAQARRELRAAAAAYKCEAVLFCVVAGNIHVDGANHGPNKPCGRAPSTALTASLEFLSVAVDGTRGEGCAILYAPEDVRDTFEEPFSVPFVAHARSTHARGVLVPGPGDETPALHAPAPGAKRTLGVGAADKVRRWGAAHASLKETFELHAGKRKKVAWRGRIAKPLDCRDDGQWARLQAVATSLSKPEAFDVRMEHEVKKLDPRACLERAPRSPKIIRFLRRIFKIGAGTSRAVGLVKSVADYKYVLQIQRSGGCSDAEQDAVLWGVGATVVKWERACVRWYDAAQKHALTHVDVNVRTALPMADVLQKHDAAARLLARHARAFYDQVLTPEMAPRRWAAVLGAFRERFNGGGSVRAAAEGFSRFDSDRPWAAFDAATADELEAMASRLG